MPQAAHQLAVSGHPGLIQMVRAASGFDSHRRTDHTWSLPTVSVIDRLRRQQLLREAEGYLDLALVFGEQWTLPDAIRDLLAERSLGVIEQLGEIARSPHVQLIKGQALRMQERYREALQPLSVAAEGDPRNLDAWLALGWCYKRTGRLDLAIESLEEALEIEPGSALINYNLACYWSLAQNKRHALSYLSQALSLDRSFRNLIEAEHDFDPIRGDADFQALTSVAV
jgi:tetratricopeptide (TPR) repeat protein